MQWPGHQGPGFIAGVKTQCRSIVNQSYQTPIIWGQYPDILHWFITLHLLFLSRLHLMASRVGIACLNTNCFIGWIILLMGKFVCILTNHVKKKRKRIKSSKANVCEVFYFSKKKKKMRDTCMKNQTAAFYMSCGFHFIQPYKRCWNEPFLNIYLSL